MQMYGYFEGFAKKEVHCLGWCHKSEPWIRKIIHPESCNPRFIAILSTLFINIIRTTSFTRNHGGL